MPPQGYLPMGAKPMPVMGPVQGPPNVPPGYRDRYEGPHRPPFENIPPGLEPPVPGFEPSPFEKPGFGPAGVPIDRDRLPPPNYREPYRPPFEGPAGPGFRDVPVVPNPNELPVHIPGQPPRYRDNFRPGPFRDQGPVPLFRDGQPPFRDGPPVFRDGQPPFRDGQPPFRDGQPPFRDGQPPYHNREPGPPYRDGPPRDMRGGPPPQFRENSFRGHPYRDGNFRDNPREGGPPPFRPPSADPREPIPSNYHEPNFRDGYRGSPGKDMRQGYRPGSRSRGGGRHPVFDRDRHRERDGRDRERYNENRDPSDRPERPRDDKRIYDKSRERHEERGRDYDRGREYDKERERDYERVTPDKKRISPEKKRSRDIRDKKRSESRGRSREREGKKEKKEDRARDKSSTDRSKEPKEKKEKPKDRKKKKKEKEIDKKKKKEKKDKKDKDKKDEGDDDKTDAKETAKEFGQPEPEQMVVIKVENIKVEKIETDEPVIKKEPISENVNEMMVQMDEKPKDDLYDGEETEAVDKEIIENYVKSDEKQPVQSQSDEVPNNESQIPQSENKEEPFDGIELQANVEELDLKPDEGIAQSKEVLAPLPELSKWEVDDDNTEKTKEPGEISSPEEEGESGKVTTEVIKRAENAIFSKAINSLRPIEIKKISSDRAKLYTDDISPKGSIQITVPMTESTQRSIEISEKKKRISKTPPPKLSVKERLGGKVDDSRKPRESRVVHSTVELVKSRSKTPKKDQPYRRVILEKDKHRKPASKVISSKSERRVIVSESIKVDKHRDRSQSKKDSDKHSKDDIKSHKSDTFEREKKKSTLDEAHFEPDYDENVESDKEDAKEEIAKKREGSPTGQPDTKKLKAEPETIKLDLANVKKKPDTDSESSSSGSTSSSSSDARKKKKKKKKAKKRRRRDSDSDSDSGSSSDDHKKKKKKRKHKKKSSKKKRKSKHK